LIILHPKATHKRNLSESTAMVFAQKATENRGTANRVNRNMLVYLAADDDRMAELDIAVRDYLGWSDVLAKQEDLDLTQNQKNQAIEKQRQAGETAAARLLGTYQWVLVPEGQPITITATKAGRPGDVPGRTRLQTAQQRWRPFGRTGGRRHPPRPQHDGQAALGSWASHSR